MNFDLAVRAAEASNSVRRPRSLEVTLNVGDIHHITFASKVKAEGSEFCLFVSHEVL